MTIGFWTKFPGIYEKLDVYLVGIVVSLCPLAGLVWDGINIKVEDIPVAGRGKQCIAKLIRAKFRTAPLLPPALQVIVEVNVKINPVPASRTVYPAAVRTTKIVIPFLFWRIDYYFLNWKKWTHDKMAYQLLLWRHYMCS